MCVCCRESGLCDGICLYKNFLMKCNFIYQENGNRAASKYCLLNIQPENIGSYLREEPFVLFRISTLFILNTKK